MCVYIVAEGPADADLLEFLLQPEIGERVSGDDLNGEGLVRVVAAGGQSRAISMGRSLLALKRQPVVLLVDADSRDDRRIEELRDFLHHELRITAGDTPFCVLIAVPVVEAMLFQSPSTSQWIRDQLGDAADTEFPLESKYEPKKLTARLLERTRSKFALGVAPTNFWQQFLSSHSDPVALRNEIRATPLMTQLLEFIEEQSRIKV